MDWSLFWSEYPQKFPKTDFFRQVGKTYKGQPITESQFRTLIDDLEAKLGLTKGDDVLDLCCGNGLITAALAPRCRSITGVDFSEPLITAACEFHSPQNAHYCHSSILDMEAKDMGGRNPFSKAYMYEALQHFDQAHLPKLIEKVTPLFKGDIQLLLCSVPDKSRIWHFYNTPEYRKEYLRKKRLGVETIGTWWDKGYIRRTCKERSLKVEFLAQPACLHTAHYRFDLAIYS